MLGAGEAADPLSRHRLVGIGFLLAYVALDYVSFVKPYRDMGITPWDPTAGLAIAVVFLEGLAIAPFVLAAPFVAELLRLSTTTDPSVGRHASIIQAAFLVGWALGGGFFGRIGDRL